MAEATLRGFSVATRCETVEEFVEKFRDRCDASSIVVNVIEPRVVGTECAFAILLANKKPILAGTCIVLDIYNDTNNPFGRVGMRIGIKRLGLESERVFAELLAARAAQRPEQRIAMNKPTMALPIVTVESVEANAELRVAGDAVAISIPRRMTQPIRGSRRLDTVQIPPREDALVRAPRATPAIVGPERRVAKKQSRSPVHVDAEGSHDTPTPPPPDELVLPPNVVPLRLVKAESKPVAKPQAAQIPPKAEPKPEPRRESRQEARTPGSSFVLPANPFMNLTDASLEGFIDCRLHEDPTTLAAGALDDANTDVRSDGDEDSATEVVRASRVSLAGLAEPRPLPPPPAVTPASSAVTAVAAPAASSVNPYAPLDLSPQAPLNLPYAATRLPDLNVPDARDDVRPPLLTRRLRKQLLLACTVVPLLGAALVVLAMSVRSPAAHVASAAPALVEDSTAVSGHVAVQVEAPPPAPAVAPQRAQPIHAVLIKTFPIAAHVTVGSRSFGTTPTYIKIPANTPVQVRIERAGFKPVKRVVKSRQRYDQIFLRLQPARRGRR